MLDKIFLVHRIKIVAFLIPLVWVIIGYFHTTQRVADLHTQKNTENFQKMNNELTTLINEKKETILIIAMAIANNSYVKEALNSNTSNIDLATLSQNLKVNTSLKNIWFQVISTKGSSIYRSWTQKSGDSLLNFRPDILQMLETPKVTSSISVGKYDLSFKSMVPIYEKEKFIGFIEVIAKFNSIAVKMQNKNYDTVFLVDKKYQKQLTHSFTGKFIDDYYIANSNVKDSLIKFIEKKGVEHFISRSYHHKCIHSSKLVITYHLQDIDDEEMGYLVVFQDINDIDTENIIQTRDRLILFYISVFILLSLLMYYIYFRKYKQLVEILNTKLETEIQVKTEELQHMANHDALTQLPNRLLFLDRLEQGIKHAKRTNTSLSVLFLDLDRFKEVNDTYGHEVGDKLLQSISIKLKQLIREEDTISRLGGDEFTIILENTSEDDTIIVTNKIIDVMKQSFYINKTDIYTTFSIGVSRFPQDGESPEVLIRNSDTAMYKAKDMGKNQFQFYNQHMTEAALEKAKIEQDLRLALQNNELEAYYQPKVDSLNNKVIGLEALIRWNHPIRGMVMPDTFIPIAENTGLIVEIDTFMMEESFKTVNAWNKENLYTGALALNLSIKQLEDSNFISNTQRLLKKYSINPQKLEFEITESQIMSNPESSIKVLQEIRALGIKTSIDDFGTGYSSLAYLKLLPIDTLKIDRSFIQDLPEDKDDEAIVKAIISLAKSLNFEVIAEGVENQDQLDFLIFEGCTHIQGYHYSKPISAKEYKNFLIKYK